MKQNKGSRPSYKKKFTQRDRAIKIIKELSEFLLILDLREIDILKTMVVRFAIESIEASQGSLLIYDTEKNYLKYQDTYIYENNRIILENYGEMLQDTFLRPGEGVTGEAYIKGTPILVENIDQSNYEAPLIGEIVNVDIKSVIAMPIQVTNEVVAVLEIANGKEKEPFDSEDLEIITIIANFASTILENAELFSWAIHDGLTGLYNNHYFYRELDNELEKSARYDRVFSLVIFDIDDFKHINDTYGHSAGDKALQMLSTSIQRTIRKDVDIAARYGGDEFVLVLPNSDAERAKGVCERLASLIDEHKIETQDHKKFNFTLSMGISEFPKDGDKAHLLFASADEALYSSKRGGKNTVSIYQKSNSSNS